MVSLDISLTAVPTGPVLAETELQDHKPRILRSLSYKQQDLLL
jgi:hypothetical protein